MSIVNSIIQRKAGLPSVQQELRHKPLTAGHLEVSGGLRGHSVDHSTYPFRVVGHPGGVWSVQDAKGSTVSTYDYRAYDSIPEDLQDEYACIDAHENARHWKDWYPAGVVQDKREPLH